MSDAAGGPLNIDAATYSPSGGQFVVELSGHWLEAPSEIERLGVAQLLLDFDRAVREFDQIPASLPDGARAGAAYSASFLVPAEAESRLGRTTLRLGSGRLCAVPPAMWLSSAAGGVGAGAGAGAGLADLGAATLDAGDEADLAPDPFPPPPEPPEPPAPRGYARIMRPPFGEPERRPPSGEPERRPLSGESERRPLSGESEAPPVGPPPAPAPDPEAEALRAELAERVSEEARLRRTLGELRTRLGDRERNQERLEATLGQLRTTMETLREALAGELEAAREQLGRAEAERDEATRERDAATRELAERSTELAERTAELARLAVARDAAAAEVVGLRTELERADSEPAGPTGRADDGERGVEEAEALLAEVRRLTERLLTTAGGGLGIDG